VKRQRAFGEKPRRLDQFKLLTIKFRVILFSNRTD
jgi:hypothetical protein